MVCNRQAACRLLQMRTSYTGRIHMKAWVVQVLGLSAPNRGILQWCSRDLRFETRIANHWHFERLGSVMCRDLKKSRSSNDISHDSSGVWVCLVLQLLGLSGFKLPAVCDLQCWPHSAWEGLTEHLVEMLWFPGRVARLQNTLGTSACWCTSSTWRSYGRSNGERNAFLRPVWSAFPRRHSTVCKLETLQRQVDVQGGSVKILDFNKLLPSCAAMPRRHTRRSENQKPSRKSPKRVAFREPHLWVGLFYVPLGLFFLWLPTVGLCLR